LVAMQPTNHNGGPYLYYPGNIIYYTHRAVKISLHRGHLFSEILV